MKWKILGKLKPQKSEKQKRQKIIDLLLENRGLKSKKEIEEFLNPKKPQDLTFKDVGIKSLEVKKAIQRIKKAIKNQEKIIVYGDYDTDGICGTAILWETLYHLKADVLPFIPRREEGYGLRIEKLEQMAQDGVKLIITVDQGIVQYQQAERAHKLGLDLIITDHHTLGEKKPKALAIVHTTQLAGCGVAWFLAKQLQGKTGLDLVTIGTITDIVPLFGPNRSLVKYGLREVQKSKRPALQALYDFAGLNKNKIGVFEISYLIGPRINAAGRMDDPMESLRLLCTPNESRAISLAQKIDQRNRERQVLTERLTNHARGLWLAQDKNNCLIFISHESYQDGVIGLVAGKLVEEFYRPAIVIAEGKEVSKASARSINEFNIIEAVRSCASLLGPHGGHPKAAGFSLQTEKIQIFKEKILKIAQEKLKDQELTPTLRVDMELDLSDVDLAFYRGLVSLEPFGEGNPQPVFLSRGLKIVDAKTVGAEKQHLKLRLGCSGTLSNFEAIGFGLGRLFNELSPQDRIDVAYQLMVDEWNGHQRLQLKMKDIKISSEKNERKN
ncbi:single-stranded-DNA-specific exonuclease RecJ [Candidatus Shapirobacteria bacterium]|nr:single-stranded-DNA-specific exonuclease RecJ [Candidatus Shapirobacteria bacterium]